MAKKDKEGTEIEVSTGTAVAVEYDFPEMFPEDQAPIDQSETKVPFLKILQDQSFKGDVKPPEGAKAGDIYNSATGEVFDGEKGVHLVTTFRKKTYVEWAPLKSGQGIQRVYDPYTFDADLEGDQKRMAEDRKIIKQIEATQDFGRWKNPEQLEAALQKSRDTGKAPNFDDVSSIIETITLWAVMVKEDGSMKPIVLNLTSTKMKPWKKWVQMALNTEIPNSGGRIAPFLAHQVRLTSVDAVNDFCEFKKVEFKPLINGNYLDSLAKNGSPELEASIKLREGIAERKYQPADDEGEELQETTTPSNSDEEIPF